MKYFMQLLFFSVLTWFDFTIFHYLNVQNKIMNSSELPSGGVYAAIMQNMLLQLIPWFIFGVIFYVFLYQYQIKKYLPFYFMLISAICIVLSLKIHIPIYLNFIRLDGEFISPPINTVFVNIFLFAFSLISCLKKVKKFK